MIALLSVGGFEVLVIILVFLIFFGAKSIPGLARTMGRASRQFKDASQEIQRELNDTTGGIKKEIDEHKKAFDKLTKDD
jgi:sec-independent protein translocase protein TatA